VLQEELQDHVLLSDVPLQIAAAVQSQPARFPGVHIRSASIRAYPQQDLAAHVIGLRRAKSQETNAPVRRTGESGIERSQSALLEGTPGVLRKTLDHDGEVIREETVQPPRDGSDVTLTLDSRLQRLAEQLLDQALAENNSAADPPQGACLIALDVWTGDLLALACSPRPSLTVLARPTADQWQQLLDHPRRPLFPRSTQMALPPGSVFKIVTSAAALEAGAIAPDDILPCRGYLDQPDEFRCLIYRRYGQSHGPVALEEALCQSCNVYFFQLARRIGPEALCDWAARFGFGQPTGIDLPGEQHGRVPRHGDPRSRSRWQPGTTLQLAVGQGSLLVTPLQVVRMMAAIANGGYLIAPRVARSESAEGTTPPARIPGLSENTLLAIRRGLERTIHDPRGTGRGARVDLLQMAGKTGTAEAGDRPDHAWFAGYAPADRPRVAFVVVLEHGGAGSGAAPIVREFVTEMLGLGYLNPFPASDRETETEASPIDPVARARETGLRN
jgi:penicillin-binding protein 2